MAEEDTGKRPIAGGNVVYIAGSVKKGRRTNYIYSPFALIRLVTSRGAEITDQVKNALKSILVEGWNHIGSVNLTDEEGNPLGLLTVLNKILRAIKGVPSVFRKRRPIHWFLTGTATTFKVFKPKAPFKLLEIRFQTAALNAGEDFTITRTRTQEGSSVLNAYWNVILFFEEMGDTGTLDLVIPFGADEGFMTTGDSLVFAMSANTDSVRWGLEVIYELV